MISDLELGIGLLVVAYLGLVAAVIHGRVEIERRASGRGPAARDGGREPGDAGRTPGGGEAVGEGDAGNRDPERPGPDE